MTHLTLEKDRRGSTERIKKLRDISDNQCEPCVSMERAVLLTEAYKKYEGKVSAPVLRGKAFKYIMENRTLYIEKGSLIVGEKGHKPWAAPTFPELCCHSLEDMDNMNNREKVFFRVSEEDRKIQEDVIIPYWKDRALMTRMESLLPEEWHKLFNAGLYTEFLMQRGPGHTVADGKIYQKGYIDFIDDIQRSIDNLDYNNDLEALNKKEELEGMKLVCEAMIIFGERYAQKARELAAVETDEQWKQELLELAEVCDVVPKHAPKTFRQAVQMYWFTHIGVTVEMNNWDAYSPGKLDQHLEPFYNQEIASGDLTREEAREILENLWIQFNNQPAPPKVGITLKESATYTDFCNINTGALRPDGTSGVSDVSYLILEVMDEMKLLQPSSNVQISKKSPEHFLREAIKVSRKGWGQPAFYNSEAIVQELLFLGKEIDDIRESGIASGCVETGVAGKEAYVLTGYLNVPKVLELVQNRGFDTYSNQQVGLDLGDPCKFSSYEEWYEAFFKQLKYVVDVKIAGNNIIERMYMESMPVPLLSVITDDCISSGVDYNAGGARYNTSYVQCVGIATITDSLASIKKNVYEDKVVSISELLAACKADFKGYDDIFDLVHNKTPKYGNDDDYADSLMVDVAESLQETIAGRKTPKGATTVVEFLPTTCHVYFGQVMEASPNGRHAHIPLPDGISPEKGADRNGPTAVIKSASKLDQLKTGGALLNQKFTPAVVAGEEGISHMASLIRSYFAMDGHHMQFNVIDRATLIKAQENPKEYENLIVRVAGYSDYFNNLDRALQDEIINRTEQEFA
ncbi:trans-4-hydroxy-L-proline dehydratase [Vagococcus bubulae]|uniref:Formate C-acetyltransferase/glycerol dehydratase family glycyl radical enzyme n=1 Tax=Vagococcus bubulae TaxID=1977868 RepID=A0A429ZN63_9ENTE|nr:trans-4-hydroxy-L-proline dehydratase [Vagococcus bubulae]RST95089.1 formate C-acetyltransferase/glycerol dehydratase family glycyl radical enzyme [Vagococcus bubulae]